MPAVVNTKDKAETKYVGDFGLPNFPYEGNMQPNDSLWATHLIDEIDKGEKVVIINKGKIVESGDVIKIVKKTKQKNIRDAFNKLVGVKV